MRSRPTITAALTLCVLFAGLGPAAASPRDAKPGDIRVVYGRQGTPLRGEADALAAPVATLPYGTKVRVQEVQLPWLRVGTIAAQGRPSVTGWLKAPETVEPEALAVNPAPATIPGGTGGVTARDISAAGRQLDAATERGYRQGRPNLARAYPLVDRIEAASRSMDPGASVAFIMEGRLGRRGADYARPPLLPPSPAPSRRGGADAGDVIGRIGGGLVERLGGGSRGGDIARSALEGLSGYVQQLNEKFTPEQEYYLGRAVAANAIAKYGLDPDEGRRTYVRLVGDAVVRLSTRIPSTFGGYHFDVLNTDEVNGISGPGGFVLLTRGAVEACATEDQLAAMISHELAHVSQKHGEKTLRQGRQFKSFISGLTQTGAAAAGANDSRLAAGLVKFFGEVVGEMSRTAMEHGYGRDAEFAADLEGTYLLVDVYYDPVALRDVLTALGTRPGAHGGATHASPAARAQALGPALGRYRPFTDERAKTARATRFAARMGR
ncbi:MAG: M48 family metalloprotease [Planctomycetota bacterium]|jgi:Zn-dependent protease with chaperone function